MRAPLLLYPGSWLSGLFCGAKYPPQKGQPHFAAAEGILAAPSGGCRWPRHPTRLRRSGGQCLQPHAPRAPAKLARAASPLPRARRALIPPPLRCRFGCSPSLRGVQCSRAFLIPSRFRRSGGLRPGARALLAGSTFCKAKPAVRVLRSLAKVFAARRLSAPRCSVSRGPCNGPRAALTSAPLRGRRAPSGARAVGRSPPRLAAPPGPTAPNCAVLGRCGGAQFATRRANALLASLVAAFRAAGAALGALKCRRDTSHINPLRLVF